MSNKVPSDVLNYFLHLGQMKRTIRSGWMLRGVAKPESVADHMYRMTMMAFLAPEHLDRSKCMEMCLIHDLAESIVGDLTPQDNVSKEEKALLEENAMNTLIGMVESCSKSRGEHMRKVFDEYVRHESAEANYVKSLDLFDMFLQAYEYEQLQENLNLDEFFSSVPKCLESELFDSQVKEWINELMELRKTKSKVLPKDSNLNTILKSFILKK